MAAGAQTRYETLALTVGRTSAVRRADPVPSLIHSRVSAAAATLFPLAVAQSGDLCSLGSSPRSRDSGFSRTKNILYRHPLRTYENDSISVLATARE